MRSFSQLKKEVKDSGFEIIRIDTDDYFEAVIANTKLTGLIQRLEGIFGAPKFPSDKNLSPQVLEVIQSFGGIRDGQTLYFIEEKSYSLFAMLWPWMDGRQNTLKLGQA